MTRNGRKMTNSKSCLFNFRTDFSSGSTSSTPPRSSLSEIKSVPSVLILDPFAASMESKNKIRGKTGFVFDEKMAEHFNPWDSEHIECPQRILRAKGQLIS